MKIVIISYLKKAKSKHSKAREKEEREKVEKNENNLPIIALALQICLKIFTMAINIPSTR